MEGFAEPVTNICHFCVFEVHQLQPVINQRLPRSGGSLCKLMAICEENYKQLHDFSNYNAFNK